MRSQKPHSVRAMGFFLVWHEGNLMEQEDNVLDELLRDIAGLLHEYPKAIERQAASHTCQRERS